MVDSSLTHSLTHSPAHSHSFTRILTHVFTHSLTHIFTYTGYVMTDIQMNLAQIVDMVKYASTGNDLVCDL